MVTGYNTVPGQTDDTPCIAASGADICGRHDAVACPRHIKFGTTVEIRGTTYVCEDRLAKKYDTRFDISCDKDMACPYTVAGWTTIKVYDAGDATSEARKAGQASKKAVVASRGLQRLPMRTAHLVQRFRHAVKRRLFANADPVRVLRGRG